jgi:hypothetical protein
MPKTALRTARWTAAEAVYEFGEARSTIQRALIRAGEPPGDDGRWSTEQISRAFTRLRQPSPQQRRLLKARADKLEYENAQKRSSLVRAGEIAGQLATIGKAISKVIEGSKLHPLEKAELNKDLAQLTVPRAVSASTGPPKRKAKRRKAKLV